MVASVQDVANDAGVSVGTVSNVLNSPEKVSAATVARVQASIARLGFVRNEVARQLRAGQSRTIGLMVLDIRNPFFAEVARGAEESADGHGLSVLIANSDDQQRRESRHLDLFEEQRVRGVLITPVVDAAPRLALMRRRGIPSVLVDQESTDPELASVSADDVQGGRIAVEHLLASGRRRIAFVGGPLSIPQVSDRLRGAQRAIVRASAVIEVVPTSELSVDAGRRVGDAILARKSHDRPDAIFAANDLLALGILQSLMVASVRVPRDIALIGYDDINFSASAAIPLSSIRQQAALMGATAVDLLIAGSRAGVRHERFRPELIVRASTAT